MRAGIVPAKRTPWQAGRQRGIEHAFGHRLLASARKSPCPASAIGSGRRKLLGIARHDEMLAAVDRREGVRVRSCAASSNTTHRMKLCPYCRQQLADHNGS